MKEDIEVSKSKMFKVVHLEDNGGTDALEFFDFPPGCIVAVSVCLNDTQTEALSRVRGALLHQVGGCPFVIFHCFVSLTAVDNKARAVVG